MRSLPRGAPRLPSLAVDPPSPGRLRLPAPGWALLAVLAGTAACGEAPEPAEDPGAAVRAEEPVRLGPVDGRDLPPADLDRVSVGDTAPDFTLESLEHGVVSLSDFRGEKNVVLVFYRGHW